MVIWLLRNNIFVFTNHSCTMHSSFSNASALDPAPQNSQLGSHLGVSISQLLGYSQLEPSEMLTPHLLLSVAARLPSASRNSESLAIRRNISSRMRAALRAESSAGALPISTSSLAYLSRLYSSNSSSLLVALTDSSAVSDAYNVITRVGGAYGCFQITTESRNSNIFPALRHLPILP